MTCGVAAAHGSLTPWVQVQPLPRQPIIDKRCGVKLLDWIDQNITDTRERDMLLRKLHGETLESIGQVYGGLTRERVRQIQNQALNKLKAMLGDEVGIAG